jgi:hypothetical protein
MSQMLEGLSLELALRVCSRCLDYTEYITQSSDVTSM